MERHPAESGQTSSSYLGTILVVGAIIGALLVVGGIPQTVAEALERAICTVTGATDCGSPSDSAGSADEPASESAPTPEERATSGEYVAIGDSFSSGEGAHDYEPDTQTEENRCHRSANAYSERLADHYDFEGGVNVVTCSGAKTNNVLEDGQHNEGPQIDAITDDTSLVTIGIGGNDADWVPVLQDCFISDYDGCTDGDADVQARMEAAADRVLAVYEEARSRAPEDARIVAVGYPRFFPEEPAEVQYPLSLGCVDPLGPFGDEYCAKRFGISEDEQRYMNQLTEDFNQMLAERAAEAGIEFVDMTDAFDGHEFGSDEPYFNGLELTLPHGCDLPTSWDAAGECLKSVIKPETFHPNADGQARFEELVAEQIEDP